LHKCPSQYTFLVSLIIFRLFLFLRTCAACRTLDERPIGHYGGCLWLFAIVTQ
jgi:hypothetical protein